MNNTEILYYIGFIALFGIMLCLNLNFYYILSLKKRRYIKKLLKLTKQGKLIWKYDIVWQTNYKKNKIRLYKSGSFYLKINKANEIKAGYFTNLSSLYNLIVKRKEDQDLECNKTISKSLNLMDKVKYTKQLNKEIEQDLYDWGLIKYIDDPGAIDIEIDWEDNYGKCKGIHIYYEIYDIEECSSIKYIPYEYLKMSVDDAIKIEKNKSDAIYKDKKKKQKNLSKMKRNAYDKKQLEYLKRKFGK